MFSDMKPSVPTPVKNVLAELRNFLTARNTPDDSRKLERTKSTKPDPTGYWSDSSMDLKAGLEVVELPVDVSWDEGQLSGSETALPERTAWTTD
jgi:hypothetical protein